MLPACASAAATTIARYLRDAAARALRKYLLFYVYERAMPDASARMRHVMRAMPALRDERDALAI